MNEPKPNVSKSEALQRLEKLEQTISGLPALIAEAVSGKKKIGDWTSEDFESRLEDWFTRKMEAFEKAEEEAAAKDSPAPKPGLFEVFFGGKKSA